MRRIMKETKTKKRCSLFLKAKNQIEKKKFEGEKQLWFLNLKKIMQPYSCIDQNVETEFKDWEQ